MLREFPALIVGRCALQLGQLNPCPAHRRPAQSDAELARAGMRQRGISCSILSSAGKRSSAPPPAGILMTCFDACTNSADHFNTPSCVSVAI